MPQLSSRSLPQLTFILLACRNVHCPTVASLLSALKPRCLVIQLCFVFQTTLSLLLTMVSKSPSYQMRDLALELHRHVYLFATGMLQRIRPPTVGKLIKHLITVPTAVFLSTLVISMKILNRTLDLKSFFPCVLVFVATLTATIMFQKLMVLSFELSSRITCP